MRHDVVTIREEATLGEMCDLFQQLADPAGELHPDVDSRSVLDALAEFAVLGVLPGPAC